MSTSTGPITSTTQLYAFHNETGCEYKIATNETLHELSYINGTQTTPSICSVFNNLHRYYLILIVIIGIIGNSLTIIVFFRTKFSYYSRTKFYLICLSISDNVYLVTLFFVWLDHMEFSSIINYNYVCQISNYVTYISSFMSTQLVVAFTSQRLFSICFPLRKNIIEKRSKLIVVGLILFACAFYNYALWGYSSECPDRDSLIFENAVPRCKARKNYENLVDELDLADSVFTFIFPFTAILIMNIIIIRKLRKSNYDFIVCTSNSLAYNGNNNNHNYELVNNCRQQQQAEFNNNRDNRNRMKLNSRQMRIHLKNEKTSAAKALINRSRSPSSSVYIFRDPKEHLKQLCNNIDDRKQSQNPKKSLSHNDNKKQKQSIVTENSSNNAANGGNGTSVSYKVTKMLICVSTVFLLLNLPYHSLRLYLYIRIRKTNSPNYTAVESCVLNFLQQIFYSSFSCNFFLYSISGVAFRNELKDFVSGVFKKT